ncbi:uncharacterized protein PSFLO_05324 [Pseudozyma flocculosa]|uniref:Secreted protein n=1 Tax=Pseudozyma flocculosa TaxID=84751 RepID=A0A5C3F5R2_9BASI|nr:uncharacterized protein PSFLO_05324 [Pseudozyma flocculosa]
MCGPAIGGLLVSACSALLCSARLASSVQLSWGQDPDGRQPNPKRGCWPRRRGGAPEGWFSASPPWSAPAYPATLARTPNLTALEFFSARKALGLSAGRPFAY